MRETLYSDLINQRKICNKCNDLCSDLSSSQSKGKLYQLETVVKGRFATDTLGLWNPANNSNPLTASVLVIGQDFSNAGYFDPPKSLSEITEIESKNITNETLLKYIDLAGINKEEIYFTNAVLCIKSGSMSDPIKKEWLTNCSDNFLKPLITEHLSNLKIIITLGKVALDSIRIISEDANKVISDFSEKANFSSIPENNYTINIKEKQFKLYPMFHTGRLGHSNAKRVQKNPTELWEAISRH